MANTQLAAAVVEVGDTPTGAVDAIIVGLKVATYKAQAKYGVDLEQSAPPALNEFLTDLLAAGEEYINTYLDAFGVE